MADQADREQLERVAEYMRATPEESWCQDVVRNAEGGNCFFGHLAAMEGTEYAHGFLWEWFEEAYGTTYYVYPINDGSNPDYRQETAKARICAYLDNLLSGKEQDMAQYWDSMKHRIPDETP